MTLNIKIELLKVFTLELNFCSGKKTKDERPDGKQGPTELPSGKPAIPSR
jgi:hypothetical protein